MPDTAESRRSRWDRRAKTIPMMLGATAGALIVAPAAVAVLAAADFARGRRRLPSVRAFLFALQYGMNDSVEILLAPVYWVLAGFGRRLDAPASIAQHQRLQWWSLRTLERRGEQLLGLRIEVDPAAEAALMPAPAIVLCRHVSVVDASLPSLLYLRRGVHVRGVIMAELLADPGFDVLYGRLGSVFVVRDDGPSAVAAVSDLGGGLDSTTVAAIFPEGRLYRPDVAARALARLAERDPERAARLSGLRHVLPPRPGGVLALLRVAPDADVVLVEHTGLDAYARATDLLRAAPLTEPVRVTARRIPRAEIPSDDAGRVAWLDALWLDVDARVASSLG